MSETSTMGEARASNTTKWLSGIVALLGAWLVVSPFVIEPSLAGGSLWNNVIVGAAVFLIAGYGYYRMSKDLSASVGGAILVGLLGLWMVVAPFVSFEVTDTLLTSNVISGALVAILAGYNAYTGREARAETPAETT